MRNESPKRFCVFAFARRRAVQGTPPFPEAVSEPDRFPGLPGASCLFAEAGVWLLLVHISNYINRLEFGSTITTDIFLPEELPAPT